MLRKICNVISGLLAVVLLALAGVLIVPYLMGYTELAVLTGSMQPTLPVGTLIYVKEVEPETLQVGDVVTYRLDGDTMVTHGWWRSTPMPKPLSPRATPTPTPMGKSPLTVSSARWISQSPIWATSA